MERVQELSLSILLKGDKVIGFNQTIKGIEKKLIKLVVLALDADTDFKQKVALKCQAENIEIINAPSGLILSEYCKIDVPCAVVGILK